MASLTGETPVPHLIELSKGRHINVYRGRLTYSLHHNPKDYLIYCLLCAINNSYGVELLKANAFKSLQKP